MMLYSAFSRRCMSMAGRGLFWLAICCMVSASLIVARNSAAQPVSDTVPVYKRADAPIEARIQDLMRRSLRIVKKLKQAPLLCTAHDYDFIAECRK